GMTMSAPPTSPPQSVFIPENIPHELTELRRWVLWKWHWNGKKFDKPPLQKNGRLASKTNKDHWLTFDDALAAYNAGGFSGLGFVVLDTPFAAVDLDNCLTDGQFTTEGIHSWIAETVVSY